MKQSIAASVIAACIYAAGMTALAVDFNMLSCCPGEDTATQARFVWHSDSSSCLLFCAKASNPENVYNILPHARQKKPVAFRSADVAYYKYEAQISDLEPGTEYGVVGGEVRTIVVNAQGELKLSVKDGTKIRISGLGRGTYTIVESNNENFTLTAKSGPIIGNALAVLPVDSSTVRLTLDTEKQLVLTNTPDAICKITDEHLFYKLQDAIDYVVNNIPSLTAEIDMLTDYLMPAADTLAVPAIPLLRRRQGGHQPQPGAGRRPDGHEQRGTDADQHHAGRQGGRGLRPDDPEHRLPDRTARHDA